MNTIFKLTRIFFEGDCQSLESGFIRKCSSDIIGHYSTLSEAEQGMQEWIKQFDSDYAYFIEERVLNPTPVNYLHWLSFRSYLGDGTLNGCSVVPKDYESKFYGRKLEQIRFHRGDIVEVLCGNELQLCIVAAAPRTIEECLPYRQCLTKRLQEHLHREPTENEIEAEWGLDDTDDTYNVLEHYGQSAHFHINDVYLFKPTRKIPKRQERILKGLLEEKPQMSDGLKWTQKKISIDGDEEHTKIRRVDYAEYRNSYTELLRIQFENGLFEDITLNETIRELMYGFTFTEEYAQNCRDSIFRIGYWYDRLDKENVDFNCQDELIFNAISSTGDGRSPESAFCVIDSYQEYDMLEWLFENEVPDLVSRVLADGIDCFTFVPNDYGIEKMYFDVRRRLEVGYPFQNK